MTLRDGMEIRPATVADLAGLKALALEAWKFTYHGIYSQEYITTFVDRVYTPEFHAQLLERVAARVHFMDLLVFDDAVCGITDVDVDEQGAHLMRLYLRPNLIGQGYGSALLQHSTTQVRRCGLTALDLVVHEKNALGIGFYERQGFGRFPELDDPAEGDRGYRKVL